MISRYHAKFFSIAVLLVALCVIAQAQRPKQRPQQQPPANKTDKAETPAQKPQPQAKSEPKPVKNPAQWALLVGVSDYPGQIQDLRFARDDARSIKDMLISSAGFLEENIKLLTDDGAGDLKATKQNIFASIDQYLSQRVQPGQQIIVFLAGHGIVRGLGTQAKSYFLPVDADAQTKESLERTSIDLEELSRKLSALKASQFTIFVDACREDPFPGRGIKGNQMTDVMARGLRITPAAQSQAEPPTSMVFYSCQIGERAYEDPELKHGVFTYFILRGIHELANRPDGRVEAGPLAGYLRDNVGKWATEYGKRARYAVEQTPTMIATEVRGPMLVVKITPIAENVPAPPKTGEVTLITAPEGATISINGESAGRGPVYRELAPNEYTVKAEMTGFQPTEMKVKVLPGYQQEVTITLKAAVASPSFEKGQRFEKQGLWPQALANYEQALRDDPNLIAAYESLSLAYRNNGRYRDAVDLMTTAAQKFPNDASVLAAYSRTLSAWSEIEETSDTSVNQRPGKAIKQKDADKEALKNAELAIQKNQNLAAAHIAHGFALLLDEKDRAKALNSFVRASTVAPEDAEAYFGVGYTYRLMTQYQQAIPQLKKAIDLRPDYYEAQRELAYCHHSQGETDQAIKQYQVASSYRAETNDSGEMAGNNLALSTLYAEKSQKSSGDDSQVYAQAAKGYELEAREYDPTLKIALQVLSRAGLSTRIESYLPSEVRRLMNEVKIPGGMKLPIKKRPWN